MVRENSYWCVKYGKQGTKVALTNAVAAGGIKAGFEACDYINDKPLTSDNLKDSGKNILCAVGLSSATAGMPIIRRQR
ncbi:hypothetical protein [uncultured Haemophilus sp.]|uniref:hypothetical protein n=1 Tax=uncultured Haemophilus sp. TaxID=237779 RepID=UPI002586045A|nr:hypothetical protein [uncultured Haemophilus sp.]